MTFTGLLFAVTFSILLLALLVVKFVWPRNQDGTLMSVDDAAEVMHNLPSSSEEKSRAQWMVTFIILTIAWLAVVFSTHSDDDELLDRMDNHGG